MEVAVAYNLAFKSEPGTSYVEVRLDKLQYGSILSKEWFEWKKKVV
jgi:hypothetical protein